MSSKGREMIYYLKSGVSLGQKYTYPPIASTDLTEKRMDVKQSSFLLLIIFIQ
jgi:hypothetical protein